MILSIIGIVLGLVAIGLVFWSRRDQGMTNDLTDSDVRSMENCYTALMGDFTNYQIDTDRKILEFEKDMEIKGKNIDRQLEKAQKELPLIIRKVVGHIEFAQPLDKK